MIVLPPAIAQRLRELLLERSNYEIMQDVGVSEMTVLKAACGLPVMPSTHKKLMQYVLSEVG